MGYLFTYVAILGLYLLHLPSLSYALQPDLHVSCPSLSFPLLPLSAFLSVSLTFLSSFPSRAAGSWPMWKPGTAGRETEAVRSPGARTAPWSRASRARLAPAPSEAAHRAGGGWASGSGWRRGALCPSLLPETQSGWALTSASPWPLGGPRGPPAPRRPRHSPTREGSALGFLTAASLLGGKGFLCLPV